MDAQKIGDLICNLRKQRGFTQAKLAQELNVTAQAVSKWENGRGIPDIEILKELSEVLNVDLNDLIKGEVKVKKEINKRKWGLVLGILLMLLGLVFLMVRNLNQGFTFAPLASDNDLFKIKGVIAYNKNKKSIFISEVDYSGNDEKEYLEIECILYEAYENAEKKISQWGEIKNESRETKKLSELLKSVIINIDDYDCACKESDCNNLYLRINALEEDKRVVTYNILLQVEGSCQK